MLDALPLFGSKTKMPISLSSLNIVIEVLANIVRQEKLKYIRTGNGKKIIITYNMIVVIGIRRTYRRSIRINRSVQQSC